MLKPDLYKSKVASEMCKRAIEINRRNRKEIIHLVQFGLVACEMEMPPAKWPEGHLWSSDVKDVTCEACKINAETLPPTFEIKRDAKGLRIACRICGAESYHPRDIEERFCGWCKADHDNIWPPARAMLIGHPELLGKTLFPTQQL